MRGGTGTTSVPTSATAGRTRATCAGIGVIAGGFALAGLLPTVLQAAVLVVAIGLLLLARRAERAGWLG